MECRFFSPPGRLRAGICCPSAHIGILACILVVASVPSMASGEVQPASASGSTAITLDTIQVKGQGVDARSSAYSSDRFGSADIAAERVSDVEALFRNIPGMTVRYFGYGGVASSTVIRGFGGGGHGGDLGVAVDGIPLNEANSHADGYVDVQILVPLEIESLTVYRGPVSALYGNFNRGGLVAFNTRKSGEYRELDVSAGGYGTFDAQAALGASPGERHQLNVAAQAFHTDSFRAQSTTERRTGALRYGFAPTERTEVSVSTRVHKTIADNASRITRAQFETDPFGIDPRTRNDGAIKDFKTLRGDINFSPSSDLHILSFAYSTRQQFTRFFTRPVSADEFLQREETYDRDVYGLGTSLNASAMLLGRPVVFVVGVEGFSETTEFQFFDGLDNRRRVAPALSDRESVIDSRSAYFEANVDAHRFLDLSLGARYDRFKGTCRPLGPEAGNNPCDTLESIDNISPKLGISSQLSPWLKLRGSYSEGFALPGGFTKYAPGAQSLDPNQIAQTELGVLVTPTDSVSLDAVAYRISSTEEFRAVAPGEFENFGSTLRNGLEMSARWQASDAFDVRAVYGQARSRVRINANPALLGKEVTGVPEKTATLNLGWDPTQPLRLDASLRHVGKAWIDTANTRRASGYTTLDLGASYLFQTRAPVRAYIKIDNVLDRRYTTASGVSFGTELLTPGAPRQFTIGAQVGF
ncbi:TonB-dependent receptor [Alkalisalibacterium limincola]|uniref:TonB-dependent receptor n=1 Tax=Alkalisalibacterium limincola TaxID=2699169 RepID=A0A5C8KUR2_9GAMM|nr:TonB-dependent receptor [Alkalisalibacterium limincola]TXK65684.1 TonB-dependent receptor [Alkalisalibacterium limincola]